MDRLVLPPDRVSDTARDLVAAYHRPVVEEVAAAVGRGGWVVVGMAQNPHVREARRLLAEAGIAYTYLEYGSYFSKWRPRLAIKLWAGWPTFPMVFRDGVLVGGASEVEALRAAGRLREGA